ncbi:MAG: PQQ-binding-like beta-propeller repeat protein [Bacteroidales bacterium]|nr:PQQ-binding-like beta-propeller repeat protein [Bacteroidales bacterium]
MIRESFILSGFLVMFLLSGLNTAKSQDSNWTHFRGSNLNGIANVESAPLRWGDDLNIRWKTEIHDKGWSSPVVYGNQIWVTTATQDGTDLYAVCVDFQTGKVIHDIKVFSPESVFGKHSINTYATPTPCIEKNFVYVHYGSLGTACINTSNSSVVWRRTDLKCRHVQGPASSPIIYKNLLILHYEGTDVRYIVALNKSNGKTAWKTDRPAKPYEPLTEIGKKAYTTPIILNVRGRDLLISNGSAVCNAYDPNTGEEVWRVIRGAESTVSMPFTENGIVFYYTGFMVDTDRSEFSEIVAVNPDGKGDITATNVLWKKRMEPMQLLTPVIKDGLIYTVDTKNNLICIDASTGKEIWTTHLKANFNASPVYAAGNIYLFSVKGESLVIKPGRDLEIVAQNQVKDQIWATPAFLRNSIILRTDKYLCRIVR